MLPIRAAGEPDIPEILRLVALLGDSNNVALSADPWQDNSAAFIRSSWQDNTLRIVVAEHPEEPGRLVA
jgi:hypothetical protein